MVGFIIARIISVVLLFWALDKHPYGYYTFLRFVVCGVTAYGALFAYEIEKQGWVWCLGIIAVLFNPIFPVYLNREIWALIDIGAALILIVSLFLLRKTRPKEIKYEQIQEKK